MRRHPAARGFSLVELLVVISIIALLMGIALPAMSKVRQNARIAVCKSNLGQVGSAMQQYLTDNRQVLPATIDNATKLDYGNLFGKQGEALAYGYSQLGLAADKDSRLLNPYLSNNLEVAECPLDRGETGEFYASQNASYNTMTAFDKYGCSYIFPGRSALQMGLVPPPNVVYRIRAGWWHPEGHRMTEIEQPSLKLLVADQIMMATWVSTNTAHHWHNSPSGLDQLKAGGLFADGHADSITKADPGGKYDNAIAAGWFNGASILNTANYTDVEAAMDAAGASDGWGYY